MAVRRSLPSGGSFGRSQVVLEWAEENWKDFDAWCCEKSVDPLELPYYRFHHMAIRSIKEGRTEEQLLDLERTFRIADSIKNPVFLLGVHKRPLFRSTVTKSPQELESAPTHNYMATKKVDYVPPWWRGDQMNAKVAKSAMVSLPKKM